MARDYSKDPNRPNDIVRGILASTGFDPDVKPSEAASMKLQEELNAEREKRAAAEEAIKEAERKAEEKAEKKYQAKLRKAEEAAKQAEARARQAERVGAKKEKRIVRSISVDPEVLRRAPELWEKMFPGEKYSFSELVNQVLYGELGI